MSTKAKWIFGLLTYGFLVSFYLTLKAHNPASVACAIGGSCETVLSSRYAFLFGLPVSAWGMIWYAATLILAYLTFRTHRYLWRHFFWLVMIGLLFSLYLLGLEIWVIHAYCTWCLSSLAAIILILFITVSTRKEFTNEWGQ